MNWTKLCFNKNYSVSDTGSVRNDVKGNILKPRSHTGGYLRVCIDRIDHYIHRLVAQHFICNPSDKKEVNHKDSNKKNNNITNLEWCTRSENMSHGYAVGHRTNPGKGKFGKLNINHRHIIAINQTAIIEAYSQVELAGMLSVSRGAIDSAVRRNHLCRGFEIMYA